MKKHFYTVLLVGTSLLLPRYVFAATEQPKPLSSTFLFDRYMSPYASSLSLVSIRERLSRAEDRVWQQPSEGWLRRLLSSVSNNIVNKHLMAINHEVYGHGFRSRSLPMYKPVQYQFIYPATFVSHFLLTFSSGGLAAATSAGLSNQEMQNIDELERSNIQVLQDVFKGFKDPNLLMIIGGSEANNVLAKEIIFKYFAQGNLDYRNYDLLSKAFEDLPVYILGHRMTRFQGINVPTDDIALYIQAINTKHGVNALWDEDIERASSVFFLNPILYRSIWSFYAYFFWGQTHSSIPHFSIGKARYMPLIRMGLTPFGLAYYLDNYVSYQNRTFLASFQLGSSPFYTHSYGSLQLKTDLMWSYQDFYHLGTEVHIWRQPKLLMQPSDTVEDQNYWGGLLSLAHQFKVNNDFSVNVTTLYKTPGFVEGVDVRGGLLWRAGVTLHY